MSALDSAIAKLRDAAEPGLLRLTADEFRAVREHVIGTVPVAPTPELRMRALELAVETNGGHPDDSIYSAADRLLAYAMTGQTP